MTRYLLFFLIGLSFCTSSCSMLGKKKLENISAPTQEELYKSVPEHLLSRRAKRQKEFGEFEANSKLENAIPEEIYNLNKKDGDQNIVWTNPDNPEESLGELENVFTKPVTGPWELSLKAAQSKMYLEKKPLMIWFTDSRRSPTCKTLSKELFSTSEFEDWSDFHLVKLRVDSTPNESNYEVRDQKRNYALRLKKRFNVKGHPNVLIVTPSGKTIAQYRGYTKGEKEFYFGRIKNATRVAEEAIPNWEKKMNRKGYRKWKGKSGKAVFAKITPYTEGSYILSEPNGKRHKISLKSLNKEDQQYVQSKFP